MREFERIQRIVDLINQLWSYNHTLSLGELLEKWIWPDVIESIGDIFSCEDVRTEQRLKEATEKARTLSTPYELCELQKNILSLIEKHWPSVPDQRFGQFLSNYGFGHFLSHPPKMMLRQNDTVLYQALERSFSS